MKKIVLVAVVVLLVLVAATVFLFSQQKPKGVNGKQIIFSYTPVTECLREKSEEQGITETTWIEGKLKGEARFVLTGGDKFESADYEISGDKIIIKYYYSPCIGTCPMLACRSGFSFEFENLPQKEYEFEIKAGIKIF